MLANANKFQQNHTMKELSYSIKVSYSKYLLLQTP